MTHDGIGVRRRYVRRQPGCSPREPLEDEKPLAAPLLEQGIPAPPRIARPPDRPPAPDPRAPRVASAPVDDVRLGVAGHRPGGPCTIRHPGPLQGGIRA